jgi:hypothetical protein
MSTRLSTVILLLVAYEMCAGAECSAQDDRWIRVDRKPEIVIYVDRWRIQLIDSVTVDVWSSWEFAATQTLVDKQFNRMVSLFRLDCQRVRSMQLESNYYRGDEFVIRVPTPERFREWTDAVPQSIDESLIIRGCLIAQGKPTEPVK